jgi:hypothetical protein
MGEEPFGTRDEIRLPFQPGDRFIQVHANGAILVVADDYQWNLATAGQAVAVALEAIEHGTRILLGHETLDERTVAVLESVRRTGAEVVEFGTVIPPMTWPSGTTPVMTAATLGRVDLVADLIERGTPVGGTDDVGATALHHAAHAGHDAVVDVLLAHEADTTLADANGRTPADLARLAGHRSLAERIDVPREDIRFGAGALFKWAYLLLGAGLLVVLGLLWAPGLGMPWSLLTLAMVGATIWVFRYLPASAAPLRLSADDVLDVLTWRGRVRLPLAEVRGVIAVPAHGVHGAPWQVVLCQDLVGRRSTARSLRRVQPTYIGEADAERFASVAGRHVIVVLGRGASTHRVLAALRRPLARPDVVGNEVWQLLEHHSPSELFQR